MSMGRWTQAVLGAALSLAVLSPRCAAHTLQSWCRTAGGTNYQVETTYYKYLDTSWATCYQGMPWCLKTKHNDVQLAHWHFVTNFTEAQRTDADRWWENHPLYGQYCHPWNNYGSATTSFNCHTYALLINRDDVWNVDPGTTRINDFTPLECTPPAKNDVVKHVQDHSSRIDDTGPILVMSKCSQYGKYLTSPGIYGGPVPPNEDPYWRRKPP